MSAAARRCERKDKGAELDGNSEASTTETEEAPIWTCVSMRKKAPPSSRATNVKSSKPKETDRSGRYDTKGGLSHFQRIEVGIEDDRYFRVVQRLIGPRGKHLQDIVTECKGAKIWIIGRGSRSWEDDEGPLRISVGAASRPAFDNAVRLVEELLCRVREEYVSHNAAWESKR